MAQDVTQSNVASLRDRLDRIERILLMILDGHYADNRDVQELIDSYPAMDGSD